MNDQTTHTSPAGSRPGYETSDASSVKLLVIGAGLLVLIAVVLLIIWGLFRLFGSQPMEAHPVSSSLAREQVLPPEPRLQADPTRDLEIMRLREDSLLSGYGWIDRPSGIARIPVDTAIEILAHSPWPVRPAGDQSGKETGK